MPLCSTYCANLHCHQSDFSLRESKLLSPRTCGHQNSTGLKQALNRSSHCLMNEKSYQRLFKSLGRATQLVMITGCCGIPPVSKMFFLRAFHPKISFPHFPIPTELAKADGTRKHLSQSGAKVCEVTSQQGCAFFSLLIVFSLIFS